MKKYTHAWLAMMAMKRIEKASIPDKQKEDAKALVKWFKDYRDFVISGAWYPDSVFKDMSSSHILKYTPDPESSYTSFRAMPDTLGLYKAGQDSPLLNQPYSILSGNLCDRCESFTESLIDSFKILDSENSGEPIVPSCNHIAMRFFILSHYIADCHMPLHCDARSFAKKNEVHAFIEEQWDEQVRASYAVDEANNRFLYDPEGYPLKLEGVTPMMKSIEKELVSREFVWAWGPGCKNTWDYMSGISQYSYLLAYKMVPADREPDKITTAVYKKSEAYTEHFEEYSSIVLMDAIESIAKVWLHAWCRYRDWWRGCELAALKEETRDAESALNKVQAIIDKYPEKIAGLEAKAETAAANLSAKADILEKAINSGSSTKKAETDVTKAQAALEKARTKVDEAKAELLEAEGSVEQLRTIHAAALLKEARKMI